MQVLLHMEEWTGWGHKCSSSSYEVIFNLKFLACHTTQICKRSIAANIKFFFPQLWGWARRCVTLIGSSKIGKASQRNAWVNLICTNQTYCYPLLIISSVFPFWVIIIIHWGMTMICIKANLIAQPVAIHVKMHKGVHASIGPWMITYLPYIITNAFMYYCRHIFHLYYIYRMLWANGIMPDVVNIHRQVLYLQVSITWGQWCILAEELGWEGSQAKGGPLTSS